MKKSNLLVTIGGIIGLFSGLPTVWGEAVNKGAHIGPMPGWLYVACMFSLPLSIGIVGIAAKGQDEHSTTDQVNAATTAKVAELNPPVVPPPEPVP